MRIENGKPTYELRQCPSCGGKGTIKPMHTCPRDRQAQRGKPCPYCGATTKWHHSWQYNLSADMAKDRVCGHCQGTTKVMETRYDYMPAEITQAHPILVVRSNRGITWNEAHLGLGCLWSSVDYGVHQKMSDEDLVEKVRGNMKSVQACHVVNDQDQLPPFIAVGCSDQGYSVRSAWMLPQLAREFDEATGMVVGMQVYRAGGHGTLAAALGRGRV